MAKPQHTAYQVLADFGKTITIDGETTRTGHVGIDPTFIRDGNLKKAMAHKFGRGNNIKFREPEDAHVTFGFKNAESLLRQCRKESKKQFKKGERPAFFIRKLTMSEFMAHSQFKNYKNDPTVKLIFKKYLLMDLLSEKGWQMS